MKSRKRKLMPKVCPKFDPRGPLPASFKRFARRVFKPECLKPEWLMKRSCSLAVLLALSLSPVARGGDAPLATGGCRVTGVVLSTRAETKAQPAENQFRMRVVDSPWDWQVGASMPVTSTSAHALKDGDSVEVLCDFNRPTRKGRFSGEARKMEISHAGGGR